MTVSFADVTEVTLPARPPSAIAGSWQSRKSGKRSATAFKFIEPVVISDEVISGCVKVERFGHGMVRLWLYGTEDLVEKMKIIRAKLVMPEELAGEMAAKITAELS